MPGVDNLIKKHKKDILQQDYEGFYKKLQRRKRLLDKVETIPSFLQAMRALEQEEYNRIKQTTGQSYITHHELTTPFVAQLIMQQQHIKKLPEKNKQTITEQTRQVESEFLNLLLREKKHIVEAPHFHRQAAKRLHHLQLHNPKKSHELQKKIMDVQLQKAKKTLHTLGLQETKKTLQHITQSIQEHHALQQRASYTYANSIDAELEQHIGQHMRNWQETIINPLQKVVQHE